MISSPKLLAAAGLLVAGMLVGASYGKRTENAERRAEVATILAGHARQLQGIADLTAAAAVAAQKAAAAGALAVGQIDTKQTKELNDALRENDRLRGIADARGLRIAVARPVACAPADLPGTPAAPGLDDGSTVEISADARRTVFAIRAGMETDRKALIGLQEYVRRVCPLPIP